MGLSLLEIPPEEELVYEVNTPVQEDQTLDREEPVDFSHADDVATLVAGADALEAIYHDITKNGICIDQAKEISKHIQSMQSVGVGTESMSFYKRTGGAAAYTEHKSLDGLAVACEGIVDTIKETFKKIIERVVAVWRQFMQWIRKKIGKESKAALSEKARTTRKRPNLDKVAKFLTENASDEEGKKLIDTINRFVPNTTTATRDAIGHAVRALSKRLEVLFENVSKNRAYGLIAAGDVSIAELIKQEADELINSIIKQASDAAQEALKARNSQQLVTALEKIDEVIGKFEDITKVSFDTGDAYEGKDFDGVTLQNIVSNISAAADSLEKTDLSKYVNELTFRLEDIIRAAEQTSRADIEEMIPEDADDALRTRAISSIMKIYSKIAMVGKTVTDLWMYRLNALKAVNTILEDIGDAIIRFETELVRIVSNLDSEQKKTFMKSMEQFGFTFSGVEPDEEN